MRRRTVLSCAGRGDGHDGDIAAVQRVNAPFTANGNLRGRNAVQNGLFKMLRNRKPNLIRPHSKNKLAANPHFSDLSRHVSLSVTAMARKAKKRQHKAKGKY